ncbi:Tox-REase-5 domain-containing protein [Streptomyces sp. NPDC096068]|uniref:Tox-REase-5 domain-containing protein n=1 Tax=Streptomyces sp. NPDC096068 TaxID=3155424 RepID=UPI0033211CF2
MAKPPADAAATAAATARAASVKAAGFAYVTARAAAEAGAAASQVAKPANDAIQLGSPYAETDSAASLVVLTGQAAKTIADQQQAVADAHAKNAQAEAIAAKSLADKATGDAKQAYVHAAGAAAHAADARGYAKEALGYAAEAATAAAKAAQSLARTVEYDRKAAEDAAAADRAAGRAEGYARTARDSADQAARDADAARQAASRAEQSAKDARAAADRADTAATEAEKAAKEAEKYAKEAQKAVDEAIRNTADKQVSTGAGTGGIGGTWYVVDEDSIEITGTEQHEPCEITVGFEGCTTTFTVTFSAVVDFFLCLDPNAAAGAGGCSSEDTLLVKSERLSGLKKDVTEYFTKWQLIQMTLAYQLIKAVLVQDFVDCWHGSAGGCAWAASNFIPGKAFGTVIEGIRALDAALKTGIGVREAFTALRTLDNLDPATLARLEKTVNAFEDFAKNCPTKAGLALKAALRATAAATCWADLTGPGQWKAENESMKANALAYQIRITGVPAGMVYRLTADTPAGWVKFDGFKNGVLLDAKHGYLGLISSKTGKFHTWYKGAAEEARRQNKAFERHGIPIVWHCSEAGAVPAFKAMLKDENITSITVVHTP